MRLLWLRQTAQIAPETPACEVVSQDVIQVVLTWTKRPKATLTARDLWRTIARFGGYLDRKSDPPPGWQTLWKGWIRVQTVLEGVHPHVIFLLDDLHISVRCLRGHCGLRTVVFDHRLHFLSAVE